MPDGDPYARMAAFMRGGDSLQGVRMYLGTVARKTPLEVALAGVRLPAEALRINERLTKGAKWKARITAPVDVLGDPARRPSTILSGPDGVYGPVSGTVACVGGSGAPRLTGITEGTLYSDGILIDQAEQEQLEIGLEVGDVVLLLTGDDQVFYIIMKVVDAE